MNIKKETIKIITLASSNTISETGIRSDIIDVKKLQEKMKINGKGILEIISYSSPILEISNIFKKYLISDMEQSIEKMFKIFRSDDIWFNILENRINQIITNCQKFPLYIIITNFNESNYYSNLNNLREKYWGSFFINILNITIDNILLNLLSSDNNINNKLQYVKPEKIQIFLENNIGVNKKYDDRPTFYYRNNKTKPIRASGIIFYHINSKGKIELLMIKKPNGIYEDPGGKTSVEDNSIFETAKREVDEETNGIIPKSSKLYKSNRFKTVYLDVSKYMVFLIPLPNKEIDNKINISDTIIFGDKEIHDDIERTIEWVKLDKICWWETDEQCNTHIRLKNKKIFNYLFKLQNKNKKSQNQSNELQNNKIEDLTNTLNDINISSV